MKTNLIYSFFTLMIISLMAGRQNIFDMYPVG